jgi:FixJ family two-component response regulator
LARAVANLGSVGGCIRRQNRETAVTGRSSRSGIIAIVDDDEPLRDALGSVMKAAGFSIALFDSAEAFLGFPGRDSIACLVLDVCLPGISGPELQGRLATDGSRVPVVFMTAHGDDALRASLMRAGAAGFMNKPVRSAVLLRAIEAAVDGMAQSDGGGE